MCSAFKVARVSKNFMCGRFSQLSCTSRLNNQWEQARVIDVLYRNDWNIIGYKIASEAWPHSPLFMFSYSLVRSVSVRKLFSLCHSLLDDLSLVVFPLGTTLTHAIAKNLSDSSFDKHAKWNFSCLEVIWFKSGGKALPKDMIILWSFSSSLGSEMRPLMYATNGLETRNCRRSGFGEIKSLSFEKIWSFQDDSWNGFNLLLHTVDSRVGRTEKSQIFKTRGEFPSPDQNSNHLLIKRQLFSVQTTNSVSMFDLLACAKYKYQGQSQDCEGSIKFRYMIWSLPLMLQNLCNYFYKIG